MTTHDNELDNIRAVIEAILANRPFSFWPASGFALNTGVKP